MKRLFRHPIPYGSVLVILVLATTAGLIYPLVRPSCNCNASLRVSLHRGKNSRTIQSGSLQRCYVFYVPSAYAHHGPAPVVISLHGLAINPDTQESLTGWSQLAERENFIAVYPQGTATPLRWNAAPFYNVPAVDDVGFLRDLIIDLKSIADIDSERIYVNGLSNGAALSNHIACKLADAVAAVGVVSGIYPDSPDGCASSRPISIISLHGTADPLSKFHGATFTPGPFFVALLRLAPIRTSYPSVEQWSRSWAERNGCAEKTHIVTKSREIAGVRYTSCKQRVEVVSYIIQGGGHAWPGGRPTGIGKTTRAIDAPATMWEFFKAHPRRAADALSNTPSS